MMTKPACGNTPGLPPETLAEVQDGIALALDALGSRHPKPHDIDEALGHLRFAERRINHMSKGE